MPEPLALSDSQLDEIMRLSRPLTLHCRDALLRILAHELRRAACKEKAPHRGGAR
jgi:hypothetical protein